MIEAVVFSLGATVKWTKDGAVAQEFYAVCATSYDDFSTPRSWHGYVDLNKARLSGPTYGLAHEKNYSKLNIDEDAVLRAIKELESWTVYVPYDAAVNAFGAEGIPMRLDKVG